MSPTYPETLSINQGRYSGDTATALVDGTVAQPSIAFADDSDTGVYSPADGQVCLTVDGEDAVKCMSGGAVELNHDNNKKLETTADGVEVTGSLVSSNISGHNIIVNGAMQIAQRGTSATTNTNFVCDRWKTSWNGSDEVTTQTQVALTSSDTGPWEKGLRYALQLTNGNQTGGAGADDKLEIRYRAEAQDIASSGWDYTSTSSYITLSFWVKSSVAQNFYGLVKSVDGTAQNYPFETGSLSANTWTKITKSIPGNSNLQFDNNNGNGLELILLQMAGTNLTGSPTLNTWAAYSSSARTPATTTTFWTTNDATFALTGVQLEVGKVATPFNHQLYGEDLVRCQRYCYVHADGSVATDSSVGLSAFYNSSFLMVGISFPVTMRAKPSLTQTTGYEYYKNWDNGGDDTFDEWTHLYSESLTGCAIQAEDDLSGTAGHGGRCQLYNSSAKLYFDAEL